MTSQSVERRQPLPFLMATLLSVLLGGCLQADPEALTRSARKHLERRDATAAVLDLKTALQASPDHAEARLLLGRALLARGDAPGAVVELERAQRLGLAFDRVAASLGEALLAQGKANDVLHQLAPVSPADPGDGAEVLRVRALAHLRAGEPEAAERAVEAALQRLPNHLPSRLLALRLQAAAGSGAASAAAAANEELLKSHAGDPDLWLLRGDLARATGQAIAEVERSYRKAVELQPDLLSAHIALVKLFADRQDFPAARQQVQQLLKVAKNNALARYLDASVALMAGDAARAREATQGVLRVAPDHPRVLFVAGLAELRLGATAHAETLLTKALLNDPQSPEPRRALAEALLRLGRFARAVEVLAPLTGPQSGDAKAISLLAQAQLLQGDTAAADAAFTRASKLAPADAEVRTARAVAQLGRGKDEAPLAELGELARSQADPSADYALVSAHLRRGETKHAMEAADRLVGKLPQQPMPDLLRGQIALQSKDRESARRYFGWALGKDPRFLPALNQLVALDLAEGKPDLARGRLVEHLRSHADHVPAMLALAGLMQRTGAPRTEALGWLDQAVKANPIDAAARLALVDHHLRGNDPRAAQQAAQAAHAAIRDNPELLERLGRAQLEAGEPNQAIITARQLLTLRPGTPQPLLLLAQAQRAGGQHAAAQQSIEEAIRLAPDAAPPHRAAVALALSQEEYVRALALARAVQQRAPKDALGFVLEGDIESARQRWPAAVVAYREALKRQRSAEAPARLYAALWRAGKADEAAAFERAWLKAQPGDVGFALQAADSAMARGDAAGAESRYRQVLARRPEDPWALNNLALLLVDRRDPVALELAQRAAAAAPDRADVRDTLAQALAASKRMDEAVATQRQAVALAPDAPSLRVNLIRLYLQAGDKDKAMDEIARLQRQQPQRVRPEVLRDLEKRAAG